MIDENNDYQENNSYGPVDSDVVDGEVVSIQDESEQDDKPEIIEALDKDAAEQLTEDIQSTTTALYVLLKRAHDTKAWLSLGYKSWSEYIENEFDFSRARSYQLINQANVIEEINEASGVSLYITEREARSIKKRLPDITEKLEEVKDSGLSEDESEEKVKEIIEDEEDKDEIDNSSGFDGDEDNEGGAPADFDDEDYEEEFQDNDGNRDLTEDDKFIYERLLMTLGIFDTLPNPRLFGEKIKYSKEDKKELIKMAENSFSWITQLLDELE